MRPAYDADDRDKWERMVLRERGWEVVTKMMNGTGTRVAAKHIEE